MTPVILAYKNGWIIAAKMTRKTTKGQFLTISDDPLKREYYVGNNEKRRKVFENTDQAIDWINEGKSCK